MAVFHSLLITLHWDLRLPIYPSKVPSEMTRFCQIQSQHKSYFSPLNLVEYCPKNTEDKWSYTHLGHVSPIKTLAPLGSSPRNNKLRQTSPVLPAIISARLSKAQPGFQKEMFKISSMSLSKVCRNSWYNYDFDGVPQSRSTSIFVYCCYCYYGSNKFLIDKVLSYILQL